MRLNRTRLGIAVALGAWITTAIVAGQKQLAPSAVRNHPAIGYTTTPPADPVARLEQRIASGEVSLQFNASNGYLDSVLKALGVAPESQLLVFSKTSFQARLIGPKNPRAIFFNDGVSVGWVRGGEVLEFAAQDPAQGTMFYTLAQSPDGPPRFKRDQSCVQCHTWDATLDVPGMFVGSVYPADDGSVLYAPTFHSDHRTPFALRWGGWYVTGRHQLERHMGNASVASGQDLAAMVTPQTVRLESLAGRFDMAGYPSAYSDMVSLMVLDHQSRMHSLMARVGWDARLGDAATRSVDEGVKDLVDYMLFVDEEPLTSPIRGASAFQASFPEQGPRDSKGRSLRDFDLQTRMMRYRCSFLIYSPQFEAMPAGVKRAVYARLWAVLSGADTNPRYAVLPADERRAIVEILRDTKPDLPDYFGETAASSP